MCFVQISYNVKSVISCEQYNPTYFVVIKLNTWTWRQNWTKKKD